MPGPNGYKEDQAFVSFLRIVKRHVSRRLCTPTPNQAPFLCLYGQMLKSRASITNVGHEQFHALRKSRHLIDRQQTDANCYATT